KATVMRSVQLLYWGAAIFICVTIVAPDFITKLFMGFSLVFAALALALKDVANDFVCGLFLHFNPNVKPGDSITLVGTQVKGKIVDISYLTTLLQEDDGLTVVPNSKLWGAAAKIAKQQPATKPEGETK